tara:strand:- start:143 stop:322 length:180 start_codon:yes stop_codon:yes gene_type:complete
LQKTIKRVDCFNLKDREEKAAYEELINDPKLVYVIKEEFTYTKTGACPVVTIWYEYLAY